MSTTKTPGKPERKTPREPNPEPLAPRRKPRRERAEVAGLGPEPAPAPERVSPRTMSLAARREAAVARHFDLVDRRDYTQAGKQAVALAHAEVWRLEAAVLQEEGAYDAARKASTSANELEVYAAKLERDSLADRVAELERRLSTTRRAAAGLADLDE